MKYCDLIGAATIVAVTQVLSVIVTRPFSTRALILKAITPCVEIVVWLRETRQAGVLVSKDMTKWPELQFGDVYTYLINIEGQFTKENYKHTSLSKPITTFTVPDYMRTVF